MTAMLFDCGQSVVCATPPGCGRHWAERNRELVEERDAARLETERVRVEGSGLDRETISTLVGLVNADLRVRKEALRECTDLTRRKRLVARIEQLRMALSRLDDLILAANALRRAGE